MQQDVRQKENLKRTEEKLDNTSAQQKQAQNSRYIS
jgi:hypothetical protein